MDDRFPLQGPHSSEQTVAAAGEIAELARYLNYATADFDIAGSSGLNYPSNVYDILGQLKQASGRFRQTLEQMAEFLEWEQRQGCVRLDSTSPLKRDEVIARETAAEVVVAAELLRAAGEVATQLSGSLELAQQEASHMAAAPAGKR